MGWRGTLASGISSFPDWHPSGVLPKWGVEANIPKLAGVTSSPDSSMALIWSTEELILKKGKKDSFRNSRYMSFSF